MSLRPGLPVNLYVSGRRVVVIGTEKDVAERTSRLKTAGATVIRLEPSEYSSEKLRGAFLVLAQSESVSLNRQVAQEASALGITAYAHDDPDVSDFSMPALVRKGALQIAVSTAATAPALARRMREELQLLLDRTGNAFEEMHEALTELREKTPKGSRHGLYDMVRGLRIIGHIELPTIARDSDSRSQ